MELRHLRYFVAVAAEENVTRAAAKLHVSQPALSRQVRDLEEELGFPLLERTAQAVRLTEAGRVFLREAEAVLARTEQAIQTARAIAVGTSGEIRVGYAPTLTVEILPRALRSFQARFPRIKVSLFDLSSEEMLVQLQQEKLDLALTVRPERKSARGLRFIELGAYPLKVAMSPQHPLAKKRAIALEKLLPEGLIAYTRKDYPDYHQQIEELFLPTSRKPNIVEEHDSVMSLIAGVESGRGVAIVPSCMECMAGPRLRLIPLDPEGPKIVVGAAVKKERELPSINEFISAASGPLLTR